MQNIFSVTEVGMDEFTIMTLIAEGENQRIHFKRQLDLTSAIAKPSLSKTSQLWQTQQLARDTS